MTRSEYSQYLLFRLLEAVLIAGSFAVGFYYLQYFGWVAPPQYDWLVRGINWVLSYWHRGYREVPPWVVRLEWWTYPVLMGFMGHILFGPKQKRPIYLKIREATYVYGGIKVDRNAACRGALVTGATGSGKSQICINPVLHSICINESGIENPKWRTSQLRPKLEKARARFRAANERDFKQASTLNKKAEEALDASNATLDKLIADMLDHIIEWQCLNPGKPFTPEIAGPLAGQLNELAGHTAPRGMDKNPRLKSVWAERNAKAKRGELLPIDRALISDLFERISTIQRIEQPAPVAGSKQAPFWANYNLYRKQMVAAQAMFEEVAVIHARIAVRRLEFQKIADPMKPIRYLVPPWGGLVADEKGNQWQTVSAMFAHYNRDEDLMLLQTRPNDAPPDWTPQARFNVLSFDDLPADTYAKLIVDTGLAIEGGDKPDEFFVPQARDKIGWGLKLLRAVRDAQAEIGIPPEQRVYPAIDKILHILTTLDNYNAFLQEVGAAPIEVVNKRKRMVQRKEADGTIVEVEEEYEDKEIIPERLNTDALREARARLENDYWKQPDEQRGGVASTIYNFLVPFTEPEVAAVFCRDNTFNLRAVYEGKVVSVALPQKYAVQRRYVTAILKTITYQLVQNRFDLRSDQRAWKNRNLIMLPQDEFQRYAIEADTQVDTIREAQGTTIAAAQTQDAIWRTYGGKEKAVPMLANLRTRWICTAATENCAEESSKLIGKFTARKRGYTLSSRSDPSTNVSFEDRPYVKPHELMNLPAFHVMFAPAESRWLYKHLIVMPVTPEGKTPAWWFGDWSPIVWVGALFGRKWGHGRGGSIIWPFLQAKAPVRAQLRWLLGLDGTFITVDKLSRRKARKMNNKGK